MKERSFLFTHLHICPKLTDFIIAQPHYFFIQEEAQEEFGWKLVHGDVFRPPRYGMLLCILNGSGMQIFFMTLITLGKYST